MACPRSHSWHVAEPDFESSLIITSVCLTTIIQCTTSLLNMAARSVPGRATFKSEADRHLQSFLLHSVS